MNQKRTILVVDDDPAYRQLITYGLTKAGYQIHLANDGQQALGWLLSSHQRPDLVLLDLLMPRMSGVEVLACITRLPYKLPVILLSGADGAIARQGIVESRPSAFLSKPFALPDLLAKIELLLQPVFET
jgi:two-component system response regulator MprA